MQKAQSEVEALPLTRVSDVDPANGARLAALSPHPLLARTPEVFGRVLVQQGHGGGLLSIDFACIQLEPSRQCRHRIPIVQLRVEVVGLSIA